MDRIAFVGNHVPRQCGIATFTTDLVDALGVVAPRVERIVVGMNDRPGGYAYPDRVTIEIDEADLDSYAHAADALNDAGVDAVCLQHEFGIFGGPAGSHVLSLLERLHMPVVTTLHTVLSAPTADQRVVMRRLARLSDRFVVMGRRAVEILTATHRIPESRIDLIPHGLHDIPVLDGRRCRERFGVADRRVIMTFGLLGPGKGLEHAIQAIPAVKRRHPDVVYLIVGATHPNLRQREGERYRLSLERLTQELGVESHVVFHDRYVELDELHAFLAAADIYITPYPHIEQSCSGTLTYAVGAGRAVVSTPYWHAQELLADGRGVLVPVGDAEAMAEAVNALLGDPDRLRSIQRRAYRFGRRMVWTNVAADYLGSLAVACRAGIPDLV